MNPPVHRPTVLIADDEPAIVDLLADFLEDHGYDVRKASDGAVALRMVLQQRPNLVIADVMMPRLDGYELAKQIAIGARDVPVILMSAAVVPRGAEVAFIAKPFDLDDLLEMVMRSVMPVP